jgi:hypothetical protein
MLRMLENTVLRTIFGPNRDEVTGEWRKLYNEELNDLYCSLKIILVIKLTKNKTGEACSTYGRQERCIQYRPERKKTLGRTMCRWEHDFKH